jgi:hypothetical protein
MPHTSSREAHPQGDRAAFDHVRRQFRQQGHRFHNLCPGAMGLNVLEQLLSGKLMRHNKGPACKGMENGDPILELAGEH